MKKKYREVHINEESWKYVIDSDRNGYGDTPIRVYDPNKKMYRITNKDLELAPRILPSHIKNYIVENLI